MRELFRRTVTHPALALGSTVIWGVVELLALQRSRLARRGRATPLVAQKR